MTVPSIRDLDLHEKRVLIRVDFNLPVDDSGNMSDDSRIRAALPTIEYALKQQAKVILISHFGRPKGKDSKYSLAPCAKRLSELLKRPVTFVEDCIGAKVETAVSAMRPGDVLLLENVRFYPAEEKPELDPSFAKKLASLGDIYINDAFGSAHRAHSSTFTIASFFPHMKACGLLLEKEIRFLGSTLSCPQRPFYAIIGGAKVSTKIGVLESLLSKVDAFFIGGAMAFTFMKAMGLEVGDSLFEEPLIPKAKHFIEACKTSGKPVYLPIDTVCTSGKIFEGNIPAGYKGLDIGPKTISCWTKALQNAKTVFWNGPVGKFEDKEYATGTESIAQAVANLQDVITIAGGGETVQAIQEAHLDKSFTHISTGGGASLEYIEFGKLPGLEALGPVPKLLIT